MANEQIQVNPMTGIATTTTTTTNGGGGDLTVMKTAPAITMDENFSVHNTPNERATTKNTKKFYTTRRYYFCHNKINNRVNIVT